LDHQTEFHNIYEEKISRYGLRGYMLGAKAGSGKTFAAISLMEMREVDTIIIVSPKNAIKEVWEDTVNEVYHVQPSYWISSSGEPLKKGKRYYITHYESLEKVLHFF